MKTLAEPTVLAQLLDRLARLTPTTSRRWGTLTATEVLCHLGDAGESVLGLRIPPGSKASAKGNRLIKWIALYSHMPWPKGVETRPGINPHKEGTRPGNFDQDRARVVEGLRSLAVAPAAAYPPVHFRFGPITRSEWLRWAYLHVDHHLRQFGL